MYDFLFYCFYCIMYKKAEHKETAPSRASGMLAMTLFIMILYIIPLYHFIINTSPKEFNYNIPVCYVLGITLALINLFIHELYFIKNKNYIRIIEKFDSRYSKRFKQFLGLLALILFLGTFFGYLTLLTIEPGS